MLTSKIKRLSDTFEAWCRGAESPTEESWIQFRHDLKDLTFQVAMLELGVDTSVIDAAREAAPQAGNVVAFRPRPKPGPREPGGAA